MEGKWQSSAPVYMQDGDIYIFMHTHKYSYIFEIKMRQKGLTILKRLSAICGKGKNKEEGTRIKVNFSEHTLFL